MKPALKAYAREALADVRALIEECIEQHKPVELPGAVAIELISHAEYALGAEAFFEDIRCAIEGMQEQLDDEHPTLQARVRDIAAVFDIALKQLQQPPKRPLPPAQELLLLRIANAFLLQERNRAYQWRGVPEEAIPNVLQADALRTYGDEMWDDGRATGLAAMADQVGELKTRLELANFDRDERLGWKQRAEQAEQRIEQLETELRAYR